MNTNNMSSEASASSCPRRPTSRTRRSGNTSREVRIEGIGGLYTIKEAARLVGLTYWALDARVKRNRSLVVYKLGDARLIRLEDAMRS